MKLRTLAASAAALGLMSVATAANAVVVVLPNVENELFSAAGQDILWDFDSIANSNTLFTGNEKTVIENPISTSAPPPLSLAMGGVSVCCQGGVNYYADPTDYGSVQANGSSTFETLNGYYLTSFSFYMGSPDTYNHLTFHFVGGGSQAFNGHEIWGGAASNQAPNGDRTKGFRVYYDFGGAKVNKLTFSTENRNAFEFDGLAGSLAVPEPACWALMIGVFGLAGAMLRRRRTAIA